MYSETGIALHGNNSKHNPSAYLPLQTPTHDDSASIGSSSPLHYSNDFDRTFGSDFYIDSPNLTHNVKGQSDLDSLFMLSTPTSVSEDTRPCTSPSSILCPNRLFDTPVNGYSVRSSLCSSETTPQSFYSDPSLQQPSSHQSADLYCSSSSGIEIPDILPHLPPNSVCSTSQQIPTVTSSSSLSPERASDDNCCHDRDTPIAASNHDRSLNLANKHMLLTDDADTEPFRVCPSYDTTNILYENDTDVLPSEVIQFVSESSQRIADGFASPSASSNILYGYHHQSHNRQSEIDDDEDDEMSRESRLASMCIPILEPPSVISSQLSDCMQPPSLSPDPALGYDVGVDGVEGDIISLPSMASVSLDYTDNCLLETDASLFNHSSLDRHNVVLDDLLSSSPTHGNTSLTDNQPVVSLLERNSPNATDTFVGRYEEPSCIGSANAPSSSDPNSYLPQSNIGICADSTTTLNNFGIESEHQQQYQCLTESSDNPIDSTTNIDFNQQVNTADVRSNRFPIYTNNKKSRSKKTKTQQQPVLPVLDSTTSHHSNFSNGLLLAPQTGLQLNGENSSLCQQFASPCIPASNQPQSFASLGGNNQITNNNSICQPQQSSTNPFLVSVSSASTSSPICGPTVAPGSVRQLVWSTSVAKQQYANNINQHTTSNRTNNNPSLIQTNPSNPNLFTNIPTTTTNVNNQQINSSAKLLITSGGQQYLVQADSVLGQQLLQSAKIASNNQAQNVQNTSNGLLDVSNNSSSSNITLPPTSSTPSTTISLPLSLLASLPSLRPGTSILLNVKKSSTADQNSNQMTFVNNSNNIVGSFVNNTFTSNQLNTSNQSSTNQLVGPSTPMLGSVKQDPGGTLFIINPTSGSTAPTLPNNNNNNNQMSVSNQINMLTTPSLLGASNVATPSPSVNSFATSSLPSIDAAATTTNNNLTRVQLTIPPNNALVNNGNCNNGNLNPLLISNQSINSINSGNNNSWMIQQPTRSDQQSNLSSTPVGTLRGPTQFVILRSTTNTGSTNLKPSIDISSIQQQNSALTPAAAPINSPGIALLVSGQQTGFTQSPALGSASIANANNANSRFFLLPSQSDQVPNNSNLMLPINAHNGFSLMQQQPQQQSNLVRPSLSSMTCFGSNQTPVNGANINTELPGLNTNTNSSFNATPNGSVKLMLNPSQLPAGSMTTISVPVNLLPSHLRSQANLLLNNPSLSVNASSSGLTRGMVANNNFPSSIITSTAGIATNNSTTCPTTSVLLPSQQQQASTPGSGQDLNQLLLSTLASKSLVSNGSTPINNNNNGQIGLFNVLTAPLSTSTPVPTPSNNASVNFGNVVVNGNNNNNVTNTLLLQSGANRKSGLIDNQQQSFLLEDSTMMDLVDSPGSDFSDDEFDCYGHPIPSSASGHHGCLVAGRRRRRHQCPFCPKSCERKDNLQAHIRTHTGERPYPCRYCAKAFPQKDHLRAHIRTHTGEKPYNCPQCLKSFAQLGNLHRHVKTHRCQ